jgi:phosphatidylserine decarboxylase
LTLAETPEFGPHTAIISAMIPLTKYGVRELLLATLLLGGAGAAIGFLLPPPWTWAAVLPGLLWLYVLAFFRDPNRTIPQDPDVFVSPADGVVTDITELDNVEYLGGPALRVGIFLSVFDVHVNRSPCAGTVEYLQYKAGEFLDARSTDATHRNECQAIGLSCPQWGGLKVLIRQIAGLIARRIVCPLKAGDTLAAGERFGMIKFGSRTELIVPRQAGFVPAVKVGDGVWGGSSILGRLPKR